MNHSEMASPNEMLRLDGVLEKAADAAYRALLAIERNDTAAVRSAVDVGFDSANTIGRSLIRAMSCSTSGVKVPPTAATPSHGPDR